MRKSSDHMKACAKTVGKIKESNLPSSFNLFCNSNYLHGFVTQSLQYPSFESPIQQQKYIRIYLFLRFKNIFEKI